MIHKMLFPSNTKTNFEEYSKLFPGEYEKISLNPYTVRGKYFCFKYNNVIHFLVHIFVFACLRTFTRSIR